MGFLYRSIRFISIIVLSFFLWTFGGLFDIAYAIKNDQKSTAADKPSRGNASGEKFQKSIDDIYQTLSDLKADTDTKKNKVRGKKADIDTLDVEMKKQFQETEKKLRDEGLPSEILDRHYRFVKHYEDNLKELRNNLDDIDKAGTKAEADARIERAKAHLEKVKTPKKHKPLDPNKLPHRMPEGKQVIREEWKAPEKPQIPPGFFKKSDSQDQEPLLVASNDSLKGILNTDSRLPAQNYMQLALATPETRAPVSDADLAETPEVQFTPAIRAKAAELGNKPVKIYNWVRNNIEYVPIYGSIQGADMCLQTKLCNDIDTASLLIALLRVSNIPARYGYGIVEREIEKFMNWVGGFTDPMAALNFAASAGIPVKGMTVGGQIKYVQLEHVWVEARVLYGPNRGAGGVDNIPTWIPLDASYKQYTYTSGIDIKTAVPFDAQSFIDQIKSTATINEAAGYITNVNSLFVQQTMQDYQTRVQNYISQNYPNAIVGDVLGKKEIIKQEFPYLLGTLNKRTISKLWSQPVLPDNLRHKITFNVTKDILDSEMGTPINITKSLPELAGKKITLSYSPATPQDESVINSFSPKPHSDGTPIQPNELPISLPAYLINVKPELRIDGAVIATGTTVGLGTNEPLQLIFSAPNTGPDQVTHMIKSGEYVGIVISPGRISPDQMTKLKTKLEETKTKLEIQDLTGLTKDDMMGDLLFATALLYYAELDARDYVQSQRMGLLNLRLPSEAAFSLQLNTRDIFGIPQSVSVGGVIMDVARNASVVKSLNGDNSRNVQFMVWSGASGSALEHLVPEKMFSTPDKPAQGISAVKALKIASDQGIPIYTINQSNITTILPQLQVDADVKADIQNAVNAGKLVTVSKSDITFNGWLGCGYIIIDPGTGNSAYMISGGLSGGWTISDVLVLTLLIVLAGIGGSVALALIVAALAIYGPVILVVWIPLLLWAYYMCQFELSPSSPPDEYTLLCTIILTIVAAGG